MQSTAFTRVREGISDWVLKHSLPSLILLLFAAHTIYYVSKRYLEYRVSEKLAYYWRYLTLMAHRQMSLSAPAMALSLRRNLPIGGL